MKRHFTIAFFFLLSLSLFAQAPQGINFQGVARETNGDPKENESIDVKFRILQNGNQVYTGTHNNVQTDGCGMFRLEIGSVNSNSFEDIDWSNSPTMLEVTIDGDEIATTEMLSVPYSLYAEKSKITRVQAFQAEAGLSDVVRGGNGKPVPAVQVTVPEDGNYLILANLGGSLTTGDWILSGLVRKLIAGSTEDLFDFRAVSKPNGQSLALDQAESSGWAVLSLEKDDVIRLDYQVSSWVTPSDSNPYKINRGKLMLIKLD